MARVEQSQREPQARTGAAGGHAGRGRGRQEKTIYTGEHGAGPRLCRDPEGAGAVLRYYREGVDIRVAEGAIFFSVEWQNSGDVRPRNRRGAFFDSPTIKNRQAPGRGGSA